MIATTQTVRERGIIFSAPMVRAILAGTKTQTRRVVKAPSQPAPGNDWAECLCSEIDPSDQPCLRCQGIAGRMRSPYGKPGDRLWVRETWACADDFENMPKHCEYFYRAAGEVRGVDRWRPSIYMPRDASRITLEITDVRVQRLNDISEADARAEGVVCWSCGRSLAVAPAFRPECLCDGAPNIGRDSFAVLWDSIHGLGSWTRNDHVWAISFRRIEVPHG